MQLQRKPNRWTCLPVSFAMVLDIPVQDIFNELGHNGSRILWPDLPEPMCRRGFHIQELIEIALRHGFAVTPFELSPVLQCEDKEYCFDERWTAFATVVANSTGVLTGSGVRTHHAVAYALGQIFDPDNGVYDYSKVACEGRLFYANCAWRIDRIDRIGRQDVQP